VDADGERIEAQESVTVAEEMSADEADQELVTTAGFKPLAIEEAYKRTDNIVFRRYSVMGESRWVAVHVVRIDESDWTLYYTTDGVWYSTARMGDWTADKSGLSRDQDDYRIITVSDAYEVLVSESNVASVWRLNGSTPEPVAYVEPVLVHYTYGAGEPKTVHIARRSGKDAVRFIEDSWMSGRTIISVELVSESKSKPTQHRTTYRMIGGRSTLHLSDQDLIEFGFTAGAETIDFMGAPFKRIDSANN
jgi:hypothetical protein